MPRVLSYRKNTPFMSSVWDSAPALVQVLVPVLVLVPALAPLLVPVPVLVPVLLVLVPPFSVRFRSPPSWPLGGPLRSGLSRRTH